MAAEPAPKISAIVATRDRLELLRNAVDAIVAQNYGGVIETIVVIDGGPQPVDLKSEDARRPVRVIANARSSGLAGGRNTGILAADGEFIAFCDDDDVWQQGKISAQVDVLQKHSDAVLAVTGMTVVTDGRRIERTYPHEMIPQRALIESRLQEAHPSSFLWRAGIFDDIGLVDEDLPGAYGEDRDLMLRAARLGPVVNVPRTLLDVHWHGGSFFMNRWATIADAIAYMLEKHPELSTSPRGHGRLLGRRAFAQAASGDRRGARVTARHALRRWPRDRRAWVALAVAFGLFSAERAQRLANSAGRGI